MDVQCTRGSECCMLESESTNDSRLRSCLLLCIHSRILRVPYGRVGENAERQCYNRKKELRGEGSPGILSRRAPPPTPRGAAGVSARARGRGAVPPSRGPGARSLHLACATDTCKPARTADRTVAGSPACSICAVFEWGREQNTHGEREREREREGLGRQVCAKERGARCESDVLRRGGQYVSGRESESSAQ
eukprot:COSAG02_NODE_269_length_26468_cov_4.489021_14_plen_192_part_00